MAKELNVNRGITAPQVRLIDENGGQIGIVSVREAISIAQDRQYDLVEISPNANPPVCKIMDYGKYKYEMAKKEHEAKKNQTIIHIKEVKLRPKTEEHDIEYKVNNIKKFLAHGDKVKVTMTFRGREITYAELGLKVLQRIYELLKDVSTIEQQPKLEGKNMSMLISPKK